jgi:hypothetical protein
LNPHAEQDTIERFSIMRVTRSRKRGHMGLHGRFWGVGVQRDYRGPISGRFSFRSFLLVRYDMVRSRFRQPMQGRSDSVDARRSRSFRPRLERLEDRIQPGDTILGISAVALWGLGSPSLTAPRTLDPEYHDHRWDNGVFANLGTVGPQRLADTGTDQADAVAVNDPGGIGVTVEIADELAPPSLASSERLAEHLAGYRPIGFGVPLQAFGASLSPTGGGVSASWLGSDVPASSLSFAGIGDAASRSFGMFAASHPANLSFDLSNGQLAIRADAGDDTVREAVTADGFVEVTLDGQLHSSNPRSASFDRALAGATGATVAGIHFAGAAQDTLILDSQQLAGGLTVQAPNITVHGAVQAGSVALAAFAWVNIESAGRIDAVASHGQAGNITVSADVFVNAGQLHADGPSGGQIVAQARSVLNAGPMTADATSPGADGGMVHLGFTDSCVGTTAGLTSANGARGGSVVIDGGATGHLFSSGRHLATGSVHGGTIDLLGRDIVLAAATVDASGEAGGGAIRIGGGRVSEFRARSSDSPTETVTVSAASTLRADAVKVGAGGQVAVWSERETKFDGSVSVRGGSQAGAGGFVEVSGRGGLAYAGTADAGAPAGKNGTLLLDPKNLVIADAPAGVFPQFDLIDPHPTAGAHFGDPVWVLTNGNIVMSNVTDNFGGNAAGAVYLFDGFSGALLSSLVGSHAGDQLGLSGYTLQGVGYNIILLSNGNYVVGSPHWNGNRGAVTWADGRTGTSGTVSAANSLTGSNPGGYDPAGVNPGDLVGYGYYALSYFGVTPLSNGNYVVLSSYWNGNRGAVTWGNGSTGTSGTVSAANSLVGSAPGDLVGSSDAVGTAIFGDITPLSNGNYVVGSPHWNQYHGAATWGNGSTGISGTISEANSLVGDGVGDVTALSNGNYVVAGAYGGRGTLTWGNGGTGISGTISEANSLVGLSGSVLPLSNGNYVVRSPFWNDNRGAVTWGNGSTGITGTFSVSQANSLVGTEPGDGRFIFGSDHPGDLVGLFGITALSNGNYVVASPAWNGKRGAATWGNGSTGTNGTISDANSLVGNSPGDEVGGTSIYSVVPLSNGNYVVISANGGRGAVTWGNGNTGVSGTMSAGNSLVGSDPGDQVGYVWTYTSSVTTLSNGNYVIKSPSWSGNRGAVTWGDASTAISGTVSKTNSLVGSNPNDYLSSPIPLTNGNYVVSSANGGRGAVTWGNGNAGVSGTISEANSLVGSNPDDYLAVAAPLSNGNYVVGSANGGRGALTLVDGGTGISGALSGANSLVGSEPGDQVGIVTPLRNGNYVVVSPNWNGNRGAATWVSGTTGQTLDTRGIITSQNSLVGSAANGGLLSFRNVLDDPIHHSFLVSGVGRVTVGLADPNQFSYARGQAQTVSLTPDFLTSTLNTGTAVVLQASNDITVNTPITVSAAGHGGALTLQAGRSIRVNASITTDNGALALIANDQLANGVIDSQRDPGQAVIAMAPGTALDTGSGPLTVELRDGAGLTNHDSGTISLQTLTAGSVSVVNNGPSGGSDVTLGAVTTAGSQYYANPHGTTRVTGNLTAADSAITFTDSVATRDGVTVTAGANAVYFVGSGTQTLQSGSGASFGNVNHTTLGTLQLTSGLTVSGSFINGAGTFDANDQPVTVTALAAVLGGTYQAGTAPQTFNNGLAFSRTATLSIRLNSIDAAAGYSQLKAGGPIDLGDSTLDLTFGVEPPVGSSFEILTSIGSAPVVGTFNGLDEGAVFTQGGYRFQITYQGASGGNSVVLTRLA